MEDLQIIEVAAAVIFRGKNVLICSRPPDKPPYGWEFPGGKRDPGESISQCLVRELQEELSLKCTVHGEMGRTGFTRPDGKRVEIIFLETSIADDAEIIPREGQEFRWYNFGSLEQAGLLEPDLEFAVFLKKLYNKKFPDTFI